MMCRRPSFPKFSNSSDVQNVVKKWTWFWISLDSFGVSWCHEKDGGVGLSHNEIEKLLVQNESA